MSEPLNELERLIILGLDGQDPDETKALREYSDRDVIAVAGAIINLLNRGLIVNDPEGLFPTPRGIRAAYPEVDPS